MKINEIAELAGVSSAAVSRYFNNRSLSEEKREAIRKVVEKTGYQPSRQASMLRTQKTRMIGVVLPRINSSSVGSMIEGILSTLNEEGYELLLADTQNNPEKELEYLSVFDKKQVDGVIFISTVLTSEHRTILKQMRLPLVMIGQRLSGCRCVYFDDYHAAYETTSLLINKGCKKIGYLSAIHEDEAVGKERYRGFRDALTDQGMEEQREHYQIADFSMDSGYEKIQVLWDQYGPFDGVVGATDMITIGAMQWLREQGLRIPDDIMIAGHGDSGYSRVTTPTLTTVHYDYRESGALAARMMLDILAEKPTSVAEMMLGCSLVERGSTI